MKVYNKLLNIQNELKVQKNQFNSFGGYKYRSAEDILEELKPLLFREKAVLVLSDNVLQIGDRYYVQATATFIDAEDGENCSNIAYAREEDTRKGMSGDQLTGTASSYARKYALNGLFAIDDTKDADTMDNSKKTKTNNENKYAEVLNKLKTTGQIDDDKYLELLADETKSANFIKQLRAEREAR